MSANIRIGLDGVDFDKLNTFGNALISACVSGASKLDMDPGLMLTAILRVVAAMAAAHDVDLALCHEVLNEHHSQIQRHRVGDESALDKINGKGGSA